MPKKTFPLPGKTFGWVPTSIYLKEGQSVRINASGLISFGPFGSWQFSPDGESNRYAGTGAPAPGIIANSLVARAGTNPIFIGTSGTITAERDSQLIVALNDDFTADNDGHWMLVIEY